MTRLNWPGKAHWPLTQKVAFRFFFFYFILYISPWTWVEWIPWIQANVLTQYYYQLVDWSVHVSNDHFFKTYNELVAPNGSGDTSYNWTQLWLYLILSLAGAIVVSFVDRRRSNYNRAGYWFRIILRYFLIMNCFGYGISKLFFLQMPFPSMSQLATPLGDYLPMRLSWMFMGYSTTYQFFSGAMEVLAGILLFYRRTATLGTMLAAAVFGNVMMMNFSFDIPVKLFSTHLFVMCLVLLAFEYKRILGFLLLNTSANAGDIYQVRFPVKWMRITWLVLKILFAVLVIIIPFINQGKRHKSLHSYSEKSPIRSGVYDVPVFVVNNDTIPPLITDTLRWQDVIFENNGGSIKTSDTTFRQRYRRGYFSFTTDTSRGEISFSKSNERFKTFFLFTLKYEIPDSKTIRLRGRINSDSVYAVLKRSNRHFQLAERQFHWLSEYNR